MSKSKKIDYEEYAYEFGNQISLTPKQLKAIAKQERINRHKREIHEEPIIQFTPRKRGT